MIEIAARRRQRSRRLDLERFRELMIAAAGLLKISEAELGFTLVGKAEMARINQEFLKHSGPTDVITFSYGEEDANGAKERRIAGDVIICVDVAVNQATIFGTVWQSEVVRYGTHGMLHLLGFDDLSAGPRRKMKRVENRVMKLLGKKSAFRALLN